MSQLSTEQGFNWFYFMLRIRMSPRITKLPNTSSSGNVVRYAECNDSTVIDFEN